MTKRSLKTAHGAHYSLAVLALALGAGPAFAEGAHSHGHHGHPKHAAPAAPDPASAPAETSTTSTSAADTSQAPSASSSSSSSSSPSSPSPAPAAAADASSPSNSSSSRDDSESKTEEYDGAGTCRALVQRNEKGRRFARMALDNGLPDEGDSSSPTAQFWGKPALLAATIVPHLNVAMRDSTPEPGVSFPWSIPLGPSMSCTRARGTFTVGQHYPLRVLVEPGLLLGDRSVSVFVRPGVRFTYHPSDWLVGVGAGFGSLFEFVAKNEDGPRASLSPEATIQLGTCCQPGYVTLAFRREFFLAGRSQLWFATVGFTYF